jgi:hypothetical protein
MEMSGFAGSPPGRSSVEVAHRVQIFAQLEAHLVWKLVDDVTGSGIDAAIHDLAGARIDEIAVLDEGAELFFTLALLLGHVLLDVDTHGGAIANRTDGLSPGQFGCNGTSAAGIGLHAIGRW